MPHYNKLKRILDLTLVLIHLPILIPLLAVFCIMLIIELREFPFFVQERGLTLTKHRFKIYKLKTIRSTALSKTIANDSKDIFLKPLLSPHIPKFAGWLRRTGLDEIPQFINIIKGDMSFVGPRPLMLTDLTALKEEFPDLYTQRDLMEAKPGITGMWQLFCNRQEGAQNLIALDTIYEKLRSMKLDIKLLIFTMPVVLTGSNIDSILSENLFPIKNLFRMYNATQFRISNEISKAPKPSKVQKSQQYTVTIPGEWWSKNDSSPLRRKENLKIIPIELSKYKSA